MLVKAGWATFSLDIILAVLALKILVGIIGGRTLRHTLPRPRRRSRQSAPPAR
jgi:hypothetical protein